MLWTWAPKPLFNLKSELWSGMETASTQPVCAENRVYFGTATGLLECLDRKTGNELWKFPTAGRILSSPSYWDGKVYVGSGDGRVYCVNAQDGSLVWRYRVAPTERRIMVYGHLMNANPVNANVLVQPASDTGRNAVVYATAGLIGGVGGVYACAMDASTGKPLWGTQFPNANWEGASDSWPGSTARSGCMPAWADCSSLIRRRERSLQPSIFQS